MSGVNFNDTNNEAVSTTATGNVNLNSHQLQMGGLNAYISTDLDGGINLVDQGGYTLTWNRWDWYGLQLNGASLVMNNGGGSGGGHLYLDGGNLYYAGLINALQQPTPVVFPIASSNYLYFKSDDNLYAMNTSGVEYQVNGGGGYWSLSSGALYPNTSSNRLLLGGAIDDTTSILQVSGDGYVTGTLSLTLNSSGYGLYAPSCKSLLNHTVITEGIHDGGDALVLDVSNRHLVAANGTTVSVDWSPGTRVLVNGGSDNGTDTLQVNGPLTVKANDIRQVIYISDSYLANAVYVEGRQLIANDGTTVALDFSSPYATVIGNITFHAGFGGVDWGNDYIINVNQLQGTSSGFYLESYNSITPPPIYLGNAFGGNVVIGQLAADNGVDQLQLTGSATLGGHQLKLGGGYAAYIVSDADGGINFVDQSGFIMNWNRWDLNGLQINGANLVMNNSGGSGGGNLYMDSGNIFGVGQIDSTLAQTTYTGSVSGSAQWVMPFQGSSYKKFILNMQALNDAGGTINFPTAFSFTPHLYGDAAAIAGCTVTTIQITLPATAGITGNVFVEGF